jgi:hypothetical protein
MQFLVLFTKCLLIVEGLAVIAGFITWRKWSNSYLKWFVIYLLIIFIFEVLYWIFFFYNKGTISLLLHEIIIPFEMIFINWLFYKIFNTRNKKLILSGIVFYVLALLLEKTILNNFTYYFQSLSYTVGNLFILIYIILFFVELVNSDKILTFKKLTEFWIVCGLLVFYLGTFPFYGLYNELAKNIDIFMAVAWVATSLNYCMYLLFTIGFIWGKPH